MKKIFVLLLFPLQLAAQSLPDSTQKKIDDVFKAFNKTTPGCAIAVTKNGKIIFSKGYGMANLEYGIPIEPSTIFHIASESKQYVAFCLLLLEQQGKLSLDDDIRKYLDYVPDFGKKISIKQLIHHTSGLRDQWQLLANAGWQLDDVITLEHVVKLVSKQRALNFNPGDEHMYCNTGYTLMGEIVAKVSGKSLRDFAKENIFSKLDMNNTHFHDNYRELVKGRAYSYFGIGLRFESAPLNYSIVGATSLFTTVEDEVKWLNNYDSAKIGGKALIEKMYETIVLNNGKKINYAFGIAIDEWKGWKRIGHGGADAGYRTYACRFPEEQLGIAVFSNLGSNNPTQIATQVADILLPAKPAKPARTINKPDSNELKKLQGRYYTDRGQQLSYVWEKGQLLNRQVSQTSGGTAVNFSAEGKDRYITGDGSLLTVTLNNGGDSVSSFTIDAPNSVLNFIRQPNPAPVISNKDYVGRFYNDETEAYYTITEKDGKLILQHRKFSDAVLNNVAADQFSTFFWWMPNIKFIRGRNGKVTAFEVNGGRILHLKYERIR